MIYKTCNELKADTKKTVFVMLDSPTTIELCLAMLQMTAKFSSLKVRGALQLF